MGHENRIVSSFANNGIKSVLLIDDAYDPPALAADVLAGMVDYLEGAVGRSACLELDLSDDVINAALEAAHVENVDDENLISTLFALYKAYTNRRDARFDPGGHFLVVKGAALNALDPLKTLLSRCGEGVTVHTAGMGDGMPRYKELTPSVVFLDYFLGSDVEGETRRDQEKSLARSASLSLLRDVVQIEVSDAPAIVLMSSEDVVKEAERYRREAQPEGDAIMALRFGFLHKHGIAKTGDDLTISDDACDTLLDTCQGYEFGLVVHRSLKDWRTGAEKALKTLVKEIGELDPKDFAYLLRFRLSGEGERMSDYLEWLFGESLRALVDKNVAWQGENFVKLDQESLGKAIEGAFEGPSVQVARLFHRVRVNDRTSRSRRRYALGDIYAESAGSAVRVVITPDCDLVPRKGKVRAVNLLTMGGRLRNFDEDNASADSFIFRDNKPFSVKWDPKDLKTFQIEPDQVRQELEGLSFVGTFNSLYAQEVQRQALTDLSRVGVAVSPSVGVDASITVWLRVKTKKGLGTEYRDLQVKDGSIATIILERGDVREGHRVLLRRKFLHKLLSSLRLVKPEDLDTDDAKHLQALTKPNNEDSLVKKLLVDGSTTKTNGPFRMTIAIRPEPDKKETGAWLQLCLNLSQEAMAELAAVDPLAVVESITGGTIANSSNEGDAVA